MAKPRKKCPHCGKQRYLDHPDQCPERLRVDQTGAVMTPVKGDTVTGDGSGHALPEIPPEPSPLFVPAAEAQRPIPILQALDDLELVTGRGTPSVEVEGWPLRRGRLSASAIGMFQRCPELFRRSYVHGEFGPTNGSLVAGKAAHYLVEVAAKYQLSQGEPLPADFREQVYDAGWMQQDRAGADWGSESETDWHTKGRTAAGTYLDRLLPLMQLVQVEQLFVADVPGVPVPLVGYIDLVAPTMNVDMKFGSRAHRTVQPGWRIQGHLYLLANQLPMGWHSMSWKGEYRTPMDSRLVLPADAKNYTIALELMRNTVEAILAYAERFGPDRSWPGALSHTFACDYCHWKDHGCAWWTPKIAMI